MMNKMDEAESKLEEEMREGYLDWDMKKKYGLLKARINQKKGEK
jgi:hypothetical protein